MSSLRPTTLKSLSIRTRSKVNSIPMVWMAFAGTIHTPLSGFKRPFPQQAHQPAQNGVGHGYPKGKKGLLRLVIDKYVAVLWGIICTPSAHWQPTLGFLS